MLKDKYIPTSLKTRTYHRSVPSARYTRHYRWRTWYLVKSIVSLAWRSLGLKLTGKLTGERMGSMAARACEEAGVLWIKLAQLLAMRNDVFPAGFCHELSKLHDRARGFPGDIAQKEIERQLGGPVEQYFRDFDPVPIAAASIAQVHLGHLKEGGSAVAVKVQRPDAEQTYRSDIVVFERLVRLLKWWRFMPLMNWDDLLWEIKHVMSEELDFRVEAANMRRMKKKLRRHKIYVPQLIAGFTTPRLLVMEFVHGVLMTDFLSAQAEDPAALAAWLETNNVHPNKVGKRLLFSYLQQLFEDRLFHADMHPGNLLLLRDSRLALIDFGSIGFMERDLLRKYDGYMEALGQGNHAKAIDLLMTATNKLPARNLSPLKDRLMRITKDWEARCRVEGLDYDETSASRLLDDTIREGMKWGIDQNWTFLKVIRSWATMDVSLRSLLSDKNLKNLLARYYHERRMRQTRQLLRARPMDAGDLQKALEFGDTAVENALLRGTITRRVGRVFEGTTNNVEHLFAISFGTISLLLIVISAIVGTALFDRKHLATQVATDRQDVWFHFVSSIPELDWQVWSVVFAFLLYTAWTLLILRWRILEQRENSSYL